MPESRAKQTLPLEPPVSEADARARKRLPQIGLALTALYLVGLVAYLWMQGQNPADLRLNELGDFLGGVSSPLAFLWIVLGFLQQSREIRLSGKALQLQAAEMKRSVDEHRRLVEVGENSNQGRAPGE
ncbi:hypothetical protein [Qipengyuania sp.]|uniref:hypothetical protein n=1 Tax=Qipengyuania sp. TaxID=2004515 RepID=UPI0035C84035